MDVENILHMNTGDGETSYANNSIHQEMVIRKTQPFLRETIQGMMANLDGFPNCFNIADLGCSSGPNTLLVVSFIIDVVHEICQENNWKVPQFQVSLNDLFENDFNLIFHLLPTFYAKLKKEKGDKFGPCFVSAVPGSFYGRLFPDASLHFVHSSYGVHWLSQVPDDLENNKLNIYMSKTSPPCVVEAYRKQFEKDFKMFLQLRSKEIIPGGRMILTLLGRSIADQTSKDCCRFWELLAQALTDMVKQGLVQESEVNSFNVPSYTPYKDEIRNIIQKEGSFVVDDLNFFHLNWDPMDTNINGYDEHMTKGGKNMAKTIRAVMEPMLTIHFGNTIMDVLFNKFEKYVDQDLAIEKTKYFNIVISLTRN